MSVIESLIAIIMMAILVQFVVDVLKGILGEWVLQWLPVKLLAAIVGITIALMFQLDIFAMLGFVTPYVIIAYIITGLIISAGSEAVHELIAKLRESRGIMDD